MSDFIPAKLSLVDSVAVDEFLRKMQIRTDLPKFHVETMTKPNGKTKRVLVADWPQGLFIPMDLLGETKEAAIKKITKLHGRHPLHNGRFDNGYYIISSRVEKEKTTMDLSKELKDAAKKKATEKGISLTTFIENLISQAVKPKGNI